MDEHRVLYVEATGKRGGKSWQRLTSTTFGSFGIRTPGTYKVTRYVNRWPCTPDVFTITQEDLDKATWAPGKIGLHGLGIEV